MLHGHSHSHGGQPCQHHHSHSHSHSHSGGESSFSMHQHGGPRRDTNRQPMVPGTNMSRQTFARIVCPAACATLAFQTLSIFTMIYGAGLQTVELPTDGYIFIFLAIMLWTSYLRGICTDPGIVTKEWINHERRGLLAEHRQRREESDRQTSSGSHVIPLHNDDDDEVEQIPDHMIRPPRSHFCYEMGGNVLRMDHFCLWLNNVVGLWNYKHFIVAMSYLLVCCVFSFFVMFYRLVLKPVPAMADLSHAGTMYIVLRALMLVVSFLLSLAMMVFSAIHLNVHCWQIRKGLTSVEAHKFNQLAHVGLQFNVPWPATHEYDLGTWENMKQFMGYDWWFWWLPTTPAMDTDGYKYRQDLENKEKIETFTKTVIGKKEERMRVMRQKQQAQMAQQQPPTQNPGPRHANTQPQVRSAVQMTSTESKPVSG